jgi:hypothetical protein
MVTSRGVSALCIYPITVNIFVQSRVGIDELLVTIPIYLY